MSVLPPPPRAPPMFGPPRVALPLAQWTQHSAPSRQPYLCNPATGEVRWLYERFNDAATGRDYMVNVLSRERVWATKDNAHLCPPFAGAPRSSRSPAPAPAPRSPGVPSRRPHQVPAPRALVLRPDEVLLVAPGAKRRFVFNTGTMRSRWLQDGTPEPPFAPPRCVAGYDALGAPAPTTATARADAAAAVAAKDVPFRKAPSVDAARKQGGYVSSPAGGAPAASAPAAARAAGVGARGVDGGSGNASGNGNGNGNGARYGGGRGVGKAPGGAGNGGAARGGGKALSVDQAVLVVQRAFRGRAARAGAVGKVRTLSAVVADVDGVVGAGAKHDIAHLRAVVQGDPDVKGEELTVKDADKRLLELGEYLTQRMLVVDGVDSAGNALVRSKRKVAVKRILALIDSVEELRAVARAAM